jgi:hypothetical protein
MPGLELVEHERFLHQSVGLWAAMNATSGTPFVFVAQDDVLMFRTINVSGITWRLLHDTSVRYVKLFNYDRLDARVQSWNRPAKPHPTDPTLFSLRRFSDRPHFAHRAIYTYEVWPHVRHTDRGRDAPQRQPVEPVLLQHREGRLDERVPQVAVMIATALGFRLQLRPHPPTSDLTSSR